MDINFLVGPIVGAVIGYITNKIAIKMLFRPLNPVKVGKYTLPFTPGVIPKEKSRLAKSIGQVVTRELLDEESFKAALMKSEIIEEIRLRVYDGIDKLKADDRTFAEAGEDILGEQKMSFFVKSSQENITFMLYSKIIEMNLGKFIVEKMITTLKEGTIAQLLGPMSFLIKDQMIDTLGEKIEPVISDMIINESEEIIKKAVEDESAKLQSKTIAQSTEKIDENRENIANVIIYMYEKAISENLTNALEKIDIASMIEDRIMGFDTLKMEKLILEIMDKELRGLVWLGALLGGIMGIVMSLF